MLFNLSLSFRTQSAYKLSVSAICYTHDSVSEKVTEHFRLGLPKYGVITGAIYNRNIALGERNFLEIKNLLINQISYCPNLRANDLTCSFQNGRKK